jgi:hypothetical protein
MCDPRPLDKKRAIQIQSKKVDDQTGLSFGTVAFLASLSP